MNTISDDFILAKITSYDQKIADLQRKKQKWQALLVDPKLRETLDELFKELVDEEGQSPVVSLPGYVNNKVEGTEAVEFAGWRPSDATVAYLKKLGDGRPHSALVVLNAIKDRGFRIASQSSKLEFKNYTIGISRDGRLFYDRGPKTVQLKQGK